MTVANWSIATSGYVQLSTQVSAAYTLLLQLYTNSWADYTGVCSSKCGANGSTNAADYTLLVSIAALPFWNSSCSMESSQQLLYTVSNPIIPKIWNIYWITLATVLYRVYTLWDKQRAIAYTLLSGFLVCFAGTVVLAILTGSKLSGLSTLALAYICTQCSLSRATICGGSKCVLLSAEDIFLCRCLGAHGMWACISLFTAVWADMRQVLFDLCVLVILLLRTLSNPRREDSQLASLLYRDGFVMFLVSRGTSWLSFYNSTRHRDSLVCVVIDGCSVW